MQHYALDSDANIVAAANARKQKDYYCLECGKLLHVRGGIHRQCHYYHLSPSPRCVLSSGKGERHLLMQRHLCAILPSGEAEMEKPFPEQKRIADVVWSNKQILFEIQCSPISINEIEQRINSYAAAGYHVVWLLDKRQFGRKRLSAAEIFLEEHPHYFFSLDINGHAIISDSCHVTIGTTRHIIINGIIVDITQPLDLNSIKKKRCNIAPKTLLRRIALWPLCFKGDLASSFIENNEDHITYGGKTLFLKESALLKKKTLHYRSSNIIKQIGNMLILRPCIIAFRTILEQCCR